MTLSARRTLSWLATLGVLAAAALGVTLLPGWSGAESELPWLLANSPRTREFNRATQLLLIASNRDGAEVARWIGKLLDDPNPAIVDGTLLLMNDLIGPGSFGRTVVTPPLVESLSAAFRDWMSRATPDAKLQHCERLVLLAPMVRWGSARGGFAFKFGDADFRWFLAATTAAAQDVKLLALAFSIGKPDDVHGRIIVLDGGDPRPRATPPADRKRIGGGAPPEWQRLTLDRHPALRAALGDPQPRVRWAAARILAVCRDERALPVVHEWLAHDPKAPQSAHRVLAELFGPGWRRPFETAPAPAGSTSP